MSWPLVWVVPFRTVVRRVEIAGQIGRRNGHLCAWRYGKCKISWEWNVVSASSSAILFDDLPPIVFRGCGFLSQLLISKTAANITIGTQVSTADERPRYPQNSYYGRSQSYRPDSYVDGRGNGMARPESYYTDAGNAGPSNGYYPNRARYPRTATDPHYNNGQGVYPIPGNQQSYENVTTASGSGSSDPAGYSTDPSSENSSVDRVTPLPPTKEPGESYGFSGFGANPQIQPPGAHLQEQYVANGANGAQRQGNGYPSQGPPPVPRKETPMARVPIKLNGSSGNVGPGGQNLQRPAVEKRKSWFGKRFSRAG